MKTHPNIILLAAMAPLMAWSAWKPFDRVTWWLETAPVFLGFAALFIAQARGWRFTWLVTVLIGLHMALLTVGGHYTYARVPAGHWVADWLGLQRNHYDRLGHIFQGFVPAMVCREIFIRIRVIPHRGWLGFCVVCVALAISASYELLEWAAALVSEEAAESFLGTQGDGWDTQWDMFLALCGALFAVLVMARLHDRTMRRLAEQSR